MALQKGDEGAAITILQENLNQLGVAKLTVDGVYSDAVVEAVKVFQASHYPLIVDGIVGIKTDAEITKELFAQISPKAAPWLSWMRARIGAPEITGEKATDFDNEVFSHTSYGNLNGIMQAGCAATACAALEESGYKSPHNAAADSFRTFGEESPLIPGCVIGFNWKEQKGVHADHVSFLDHVMSDGSLACLGGNQSHQVKVSVFSAKYIDFVRFPVEKLDVTPVTPQT